MAGIIGERSGVINIAIEGQLLAGALLQAFWQALLIVTGLG